MKEIEIGTKKYNISCHASCYREYSDIFNRNIFKDLRIARSFFVNQFKETKKLTKKNPKISDEELSNKIFESVVNEIDDFVECITKLCWICIHDNDKGIEDYEKWFTSLERLSLSDDWITEVMSVTADCFR